MQDRGWRRRTGRFSSLDVLSGQIFRPEGSNARVFTAFLGSSCAKTAFLFAPDLVPSAVDVVDVRPYPTDLDGRLRIAVRPDDECQTEGAHTPWDAVLNSAAQFCGCG